MKTFEIELRRTSYVTVTVQAEDKDQAEDIAWKELERRDHEDGYSDWSIESIEELK